MPELASPTHKINGVPIGANTTPARHGGDPRIAALRRFALSITVFNIVGHLILGFEQAYLTPVVGVLTAYAVSLGLETVDAWARGATARYRGSFVDLVNFLLPAHIAGLACAMLLYGNERLMPTIFAATVAVSSKYVIRIPVRGSLRHVFNPSNLGITTTLLLFTWVSIAPPYQFTENVGSAVDWILPAAILVAGTMINAKLTNRIPLIAGWVGGFVAQAVLRAVIFDHALVAALLPMVGVAFVLFTNYMITDPGTTPSAPRNQVVFGAVTAFVYSLLVLLHVSFGLFFALTIVCAGRLVMIFAAQVWRVMAPVPAAVPAGFTPATVRPPVSVPIGSVPIGSVPVGSVPVGSVPVGSVPVTSVPLDAMPVAAASGTAT